MNSALKPPTPSIPRPKSDRPTPPKTGKPPAAPSPYANAPFKPILPAKPTKPAKPALPVAVPSGRLPSSLGKQPTGPVTRVAAKVVPVRQKIEQQVVDFQAKQMAIAKRVDAAEKADKRAQVSARHGLS